ncbi:hypothetical protein MRX96_051753 [Rhipicephalus microplus]
MLGGDPQRGRFLATWSSCSKPSRSSSRKLHTPRRASSSRRASVQASSSRQAAMATPPAGRLCPPRTSTNWPSQCPSSASALSDNRFALQLPLAFKPFRKRAAVARWECVEVVWQTRQASKSGTRPD